MKRTLTLLTLLLALLALLAWLIILSPYPATVFMGGAAACLSLPVYRWLRARMSRIVAVSVYSTGLCACLLAPFVVVTVLVAPQAVAGVRRLNEWRASGWAISPRLAETFDSVWNWLMKVPGLSDWLTEVSDNLSAIINSSIKTAVSGGLGLAGSTMTAVWLAFLFVVLAGLGVVYATVGYDSEKIYVWAATGLHPVDQHLDPDEFLDVVKMPFEQALNMVLDGTIRDSKTQVGLMKYALVRDKA